MIEHVTNHVFGGPPSLDAQDLLAREFKRTGTMKNLMTKALVITTNLPNYQLPPSLFFSSHHQQPNQPNNPTTQ